MKKYIHLTLVLFVIAALSGLVLGAVNEMTQPYIKEAEANYTNQGLKKVFSKLSNSEVLDIETNKVITGAYAIYDSSEELIGHVIAVNAPGSYSGELNFLVGINLDGEVVGTSYLTMQETSGLGTKVDPKQSTNEVTKTFNEQFKNIVGLVSGKAIYADDTEKKLDTISGATYSSRSVIDGIEEALKFYKNSVEPTIEE